MVLDSTDRTIFRLVWLALSLSLASALLLGLAQQGGAESGVAFALAFAVVFWFLSLPVHAWLVVTCIARYFGGGAGKAGWALIYLLVAVLGHVIVAAHFGAFDSVGQKLADWQRERELPSQSALERALLDPVDVASVKAALAAGADPDAPTLRDPRNSHLINAALRGNLQLLDALLNGGADPNRRSLRESGHMGISMGKPMPLDVAAVSESAQRLAMVKRLLSAGADPVSGYLQLGACLRGDLQLLDLAISVHAAKRVDNEGQGCMHLAAWGGHAHMVERLVRDGYDPNASNSAGRLPLDHALARNKYLAALALLKAGARATVTSRLANVMTRTGNDPDLMSLQRWLRDNPQ